MSCYIEDRALRRAGVEPSVEPLVEPSRALCRALVEPCCTLRRACTVSSPILWSLQGFYRVFLYSANSKAHTVILLSYSCHGTINLLLFSELSPWNQCCHSSHFACSTAVSDGILLGSDGILLPNRLIPHGNCTLCCVEAISQLGPTGSHHF